MKSSLSYTTGQLNALKGTVVSPDSSIAVVGGIDIGGKPIWIEITLSSFTELIQISASNSTNRFTAWRFDFYATN